MEQAPLLRLVRSAPQAAAPTSVVATEEVRAAPAAADEELAAIFRDHTRYVAAIALRILGRDAEVDDIVQEVFLAALSGLRDRSSPAAVRGWLATVTVRRTVRRLRQRRLRRLFGLDQKAAPVPAPGVSAEDRVMINRVYEVLDQLPVEQRVAWALRHLEGEPLDRVAALCECSLATAKRRIAAAHTTLERRLGDG